MSFDILSAGIGAVVFLILLFVLYKALMSFTSLGEDEHNAEETNERLSMADAERHRRVGFRRRVSKQTATMKMFFASILVLLVYFAVAIYQIAQTGSPSEVAYTGYVELGIGFLFCVIAGIWFKTKQTSKAGEIQIMKEQDEGNDRQTIKFDRRLVHTTGDGNDLVPQLKSRPFLGLFWRPLLTADDPELRGSDHRLPDDRVIWEIPNDDSAVWDPRTGEVTVRAKDVETVDNPNRAADYEIVPSDRKSKSEINQLKTEINELESELKKERIEVAILSESLTDVENILTNEEHSNLKRIQQAREALEDDKPDHQYAYDEREPERGRGRGRGQPPASSD